MNTDYTPVISTASDDVDASVLLLKPIASIDRIIEAIREYGLLKSKLLGEHDYQVIRGKKYIKKSGFRKLSTAFGISTQIMREHRLDFADYFVYEITVRAIASNGRYIETCSSCASNEREFAHPENDTRATAQTRASNRAIADLIGSSETSAEEMYLEDTKTGASERIRTVKPPSENSTYSQSMNDDHSDRGSWSDSMTIKQKSLLVKLIESRYQDEQTRSGLFQRLHSLTKKEAGDAIKKMLEAQYSHQ